MNKVTSTKNQNSKAKDGSTVQISIEDQPTYDLDTNIFSNYGPIIDYPAWVVVENAGCDDEDMWSDHYTLKAAIKELEAAGGTDNGFDIMKRQPDGTLTTEF